MTLPQGFFRHVLGTAVLAALLLSTNPALAETLKGGLQETDVSLNRMRDISKDIKALQRSADKLYLEASRKVISTESSSNIVGGTIVAGTGLSIPVAYEYGAYLPPRKELLHEFLDEIGPTIRQLKEGVDEMEHGRPTVMVPSAIKEDFQEMFVQWSELVKGINLHYDKIVTYIERGKITNRELKAYAIELKHHVNALDTTIKESSKLVKLAHKKDNKNEKRVPIAFHFVEKPM